MGNAKTMQARRGDKVALAKYINSEGSDTDLEELWQAFDKDHSGGIDEYELQEIVFHLIIIFWEFATPQKTVPKRDQLQSVTDHICDNIMFKCKVDKNKDGLITRNEFGEFGTYVQDQWKACTDKVCKNRKNKTASFRATTSIMKEVGNMIT